MDDHIVTIEIKAERVNEPFRYSLISRSGRYVASGEVHEAVASALERMAADLRGENR